MKIEDNVTIKKFIQNFSSISIENNFFLKKAISILINYESIDFDRDTIIKIQTYTGLVSNLVKPEDINKSDEKNKIEEYSEKIIISIYTDIILGISDKKINKHIHDIDIREKKLHTYIDMAFRKSGIVSYADKYSKQADNGHCAKIGWFIGTLIMAAVTFFTALWFYNSDIPFKEHEYFKFTYFLTMKIFIMFFLLMALAWCAKMYRLSKQYEIINIHKALATKTYNVFMNSTTDEYTKNAILTSAVNTLFSIPNTGYIQETQNNANQSEQIVKLITALLPKLSVSMKSESKS